MSRLIIWGAGELGSRVGKLWRQAGGAVIGFTQTDKRHAELRAVGIESRFGSPQAFLKPDDALLFSLPGHATQKTAVETLGGTPPPARAVLISTTGYYGLPQGMVNESTPRGEGERPASIEETEQAFYAWAGEAGVVLRLGGLYAPGRGPFSVLERRGAPKLGPPNKTLALIHYDDAATATVAALRHPKPQSVYLAVTPPCPTRQEFYRAACERSNLPPPEFSQPVAHPPAAFDVTWLRRDLLPRPAHPDWREVLQ